MNKISNVFWISLAILLIAVIFGVAAPISFESVTSNVESFITSSFGWYYLILVSVIVAFCLFLILALLETHQAWQGGERPEYSKPTWFAMLFGVLACRALA